MAADVPLDGLDLDALPDGTGQPAPTFFRPEVINRVVVEQQLDFREHLTMELDTSMVFSASEVPDWALKVGVFDLETTGIDPTTARIVSAHVGVLDPTGTPIESTNWLADPGIDIPEGAAAIHGISTERARAEGRPARAVVSEIIEALRSLAARGIPVVIYNAPYDLTVLLHEAHRHGLVPLDHSPVIIDPLVIDKAVDRYRKGKRTLSAAAEYYGVRLVDAHDSSADAIAAGRVAQALARRHAATLWASAAELHDLQVAWCREQTDSFIEYMRRVRDPDFTTSAEWPVRLAILAAAE